MHDISVSHIDDLPSEQLEIYWNTLYPACQVNIFLSWIWIGNWLASHAYPYSVVIARKDGQIVGLCILVRNRQRRHGVFFSDQLCLHRTGRPKDDQSWIEYNDFLVQQKNGNQVRLALAEYITNKMHWDELVIGASQEPVFTPFKLLGLKKRVFWASQSYQVDLAHLRHHQQTYLSTCSNNTRYQINRSIRIYKKKGPLTIARAENGSQALTWLHEAGPLHIKRWHDKKVGSGFSNDKFVAFHSQFIRQNIDQGSIDILKICAGNYVIGYLYNIIQDQEVKFYLSANYYDQSEKNIKPGLVCHYLAIEYYRSQGYDTYDFMGGESQYKRSLSSVSSPIFVGNVQKPRLKLKIENVLRAIKQRYLLSKQTAESLAPINFIITGGAQNPTDDGPHYHSAKVALCRIQGDQSLEVLASQEYTPPPDIQHPNTNVIFKSAHRHQDRLWITTETEIVEYQLPQLQQVKTHSHPSFNDLHHVIKHKDKLFVVNTGLNCVTEYDPNNQAVIHHKVDSHSVLDVQQDTDYRQRVSTKPHLCHPNFCFVIDQQIWVTRCDLMDAICLDDHSKRIDIGSGLVHDGVVFNKYVYFSTVDGLIKIFNIESFCLIACIDMSLYVPDLNGWCRGIMPLSYNRLLVGISQFRPSKRPLKSKGSAARILCIDIHSQKLIWQSSTQELGIDTIFSLLPGDML